MHFLFVEEKIIEEQFHTELLSAKALRVDTQYYVTEQVDKEKLKNDSATARKFVLKMEEIIEKITEIQINSVRQKLICVSISKMDKNVPSDLTPASSPCTPYKHP